MEPGAWYLERGGEKWEGRGGEPPELLLSRVSGGIVGSVPLPSWAGELGFFSADKCAKRRLSDESLDDEPVTKTTCGSEGPECDEDPR